MPTDTSGPKAFFNTSTLVSQARPGSTQATCFERVRRGIGSLTHPRLTIGVGLEAVGMQRPIRQA